MTRQLWEHAFKVTKMGRGRIDIIADILTIAKKGAKKTHIMYKANMSYRMLSKYLSYLIKMKFLSRGASFHTTEKGLEFLRAYKTLKKLMKKEE